MAARILIVFAVISTLAARARSDAHENGRARATRAETRRERLNGGPLEVTWTSTTTNGDPFLTDPGGNYLFVPQVELTFPATASHNSSNIFGTVIQVQVVKIPNR